MGSFVRRPSPAPARAARPRAASSRGSMGGPTAKGNRSRERPGIGPMRLVCENLGIGLRWSPTLTDSSPPFSNSPGQASLGSGERLRWQPSIDSREMPVSGGGSDPLRSPISRGSDKTSDGFRRNPAVFSRLPCQPGSHCRTAFGRPRPALGSRHAFRRRSSMWSRCRDVAASVGVESFRRTCQSRVARSPTGDEPCGAMNRCLPQS